MNLDRISFTTFNLYNLNEPGAPMYRDATGWTAAQYAKKIEWTGHMLNIMGSEVYGFQELWHGQSLAHAFRQAGLATDYAMLVPHGHAGGRIVCAAAVRADILAGDPEWITSFPDEFRLQSQGDDPQTSEIAVNIDSFSRPVLHFVIRPRDDTPDVHVYVCHLKSKLPTRIDSEPWFEAAADIFGKHRDAIGGAISTIRRTAEAAALRFILTERMKGTDTPVILLGDVNDGQCSNTVAILSSQPNYLIGLSKGGGDNDLYTAQTLQQYRSTRDVYYTHIFQNERESLDQIMLSQEFYDNSRKRIWAFDGMDVNNDHLNYDDHKLSGTNDHGIIRAAFRDRPVAGVGD